MSKLNTTCPYCGVGCGVTTDVAKDQIIAVSGDRSHPANNGLLCVKGSALHETMSMQGRLLSPFIDGEKATWQDAVDRVADGFRQTIAKHGPNSVAFYLSGQLLTEDYYVANKLMKGFIGSGNVDTNSRLCMASAVAGYKRAFGSDTVPGNYEDLECCDLLVMVGSNAAWTHPILYQRIVKAKAGNPQMRVVVIDPKITATADIADLVLTINPGTDTQLFNGLLSYLTDNNSLDHSFIDAHTEGFKTTLDSVHIDLAEVSEKTGIDGESLVRFYDWFQQTNKTVTFYSQGINQSATGTDKCNAIINCHLATGRIGKPGMGPFSVTGQPNAMGGREVGGLANQLAAHMDFSEDNCDRVGRFWNSPNIARQPGKKAVELFDAVESGEIKAVWIMATNPVVSMPEADRVKAALKKCPLVVVSDCVAKTDTTALADVLLPATGWAEKDGTVTNSERCISRQRSAVGKPGEAKHDWEIVCEVARAMGYSEAFSYETPSQIFAEHAALSGFENRAERDFDISYFANITDQQYRDLTPVQWPVNEASPDGTARMFVDYKFFTKSGKARFVASESTDNAVVSGSREPFLLNTGRVRDQWHSMTRSGKSPRLMDHVDTPFLEINPSDASSANIGENELVEVSNSLGTIRLPARISNSVKAGQIFAPIHWNDQFAYPAKVDNLVPSITDPISGQPESKNIPVSLQRVDTESWARLITRDSSLVQTLIDKYQTVFWARVNLRDAYRLDIALGNPEQLDELISFFSNADLRYSTGQMRAFMLGTEGINQSLVHICENFQSLPDPVFTLNCVGKPRKQTDWLYLAGNSGKESKPGRMICSCHGVYEADIQASIDRGICSAAGLGERLKCGTNCGSCLPEINGMIAAYKESCKEVDIA